MPVPLALRHFTLPAIVAGLVAVLVSYTSSAAIVFQAAQAAGATVEQTGSWLVVLGLAMGITTIGLSWKYRIPVLTAWSTPGAVVLTAGFHDVTLSEAVGVFIFSNALILLSAVTGLFARIMRIIPQAICAAMLAGILLRFGLNAFTGLQQNFLLCGAMCLAFVIGRQRMARYAILLTLLVGLAVAMAQQAIHLPPQPLRFALPEFVAPHFSLAALLGVGIPFFIVTMASQNAPGIATLQAFGYQPPVSSLIGWTGFTALLLSPFGGFSVCIAAITAAICMSEEIHPDRQQRYAAAVVAGLFYLIAGALGGAVGLLFSALPGALIQTLAGLALLATIAGSIQQALAQEAERDAAMIAFLVTASGIQLLGIGAPLWGLVAGLLACVIQRLLAKRKI